MTIRGQGTAVIPGVTAREVFDFVLDPAQYLKADTKVLAVTKLADTADGMLAREDGVFLKRFRGSVITRYRWSYPGRITVTLESGLPETLNAWFAIDETEGGTRLHHAEEMHFGHGPLGILYDAVARRWFARAVEQEVAEIARLLRAGERGRGIAAHAHLPTEPAEPTATDARRDQRGQNRNAVAR
jgi:hypothetical protein